MRQRNAIAIFLLSILMLCGGRTSAQALNLSQIAREWIPAGDPGTIATQSNRGAVTELSTRFRQDGAKRACWDLPIAADLSQTAALRIRMRCLNADLASQMDLFLHVDGVWMRAELTPSTVGLWEEVILSKAAFLPEGSATRELSWQRCDRLRIAAWRGAEGAFALHLASLEFLTANVPLALIRGGMHEGYPENARAEAFRHAKTLGNALAEGGIYPAVIDEADLTASALQKIRCVALPFGEALGENAVNQLCAFLRQGGKIAGFHTLPPRIANAMRLPTGKFLKASVLPQPLSGIQTAGGATFRQSSAAFLAVQAQQTADLKFRAWWIDATGHRTPYPAIVHCPYGFWMTHVFLNQDQEHAIPVLAAFLEDFVPALRRTAGNELFQRARFALANSGPGTHTPAKTALKRLSERSAANDYPGAFGAFLQLRSALADEALPGSTTNPTETNGSTASAATSSSELRGAWMRSPTGLPNAGWARTLRQMKIAQYNAVFPHFLSPYATAWPSVITSGRLAPKADDAVAECTAAAANLGMQVHAWVQVLNVVDAPAAIRQKWDAQGRLQKKANGQTIPWLCPTQRENRLLLTQLVTELARKYAIDGIQLDMLRFESSAGCYCDRCRAAFTRFLTHAPADWPNSTRDVPNEKKQWEAFRIHQVTQLAAELAAAARKARPRITVSAAVYSSLESARRNVGQDWLQWLKTGVVDFVCPMDYRPTAALLQGDLARQRTEAGELAAKIRPGLGATVHNLSKQDLKRQIQTVRAAGLDGFVVFEFKE